MDQWPAAVPAWASAAEHGDLPQANWMKLRWLRWLAERGEWKTFVNYYDPKMNFTELDCLYGQYQIKNGLKAEGYKSAEKLWLVGKSQPEACDVLFDLWRAEGQMTEQMRWRRAKHAAEAAVASEDFAAAMHAIATLRPVVDAFFDQVTVNVDDKVVRENRLRLLNEIREAARAVADFSKIEG